MADNPFDDPFAASGGDGDNPFASTTPAFEDDNPFATPAPMPVSSVPAKKKKKKKSAASGSTGSGTKSGFRATSTASYTPIETSSRTAGNGGDDDGASMFSKPANAGSMFSGAASSLDYGDKVEALNRREAELEAKQVQLVQKEEELQRMLAKIQGMRPANWPRCRPIIHHDIKGEIPREFQSTVRRMYMLYYWTLLTLTFNFVVQIWAMVAKVGDIVGFFLALAYMLFAPFLALGFWYVPQYAAMRVGKASKFVSFFMGFIIHILFIALLLVGITKVGGAGIVTAVRLSQAGYHLGTTLCVVNIFFLLILLICSIAMIRVVHSIYRGRGGDLSRDSRALLQESAAQGAVFAAKA
ncbi:uncharacterized protein AMSG_03809 [Thecamonas trahens ATCC 50062]|uniref:Secretory carrier membrane protein n=1 Tax=Thecamonas trahens ATCC 50062 TaxID=461836 RepID=A0A0L0D565_THETB|nr:hypothetical protein AMSG_03809 [Thecamonas trahens ATCC 50062]KNC47375.1 hypothetical protein AMSG_03809 [Thecamonas trahens ATCC 50062]|eukprot:XP_013759713.1 hypothetical protein AMSG_03809 [Thecamonas trahens ATCC 50062]